MKVIPQYLNEGVNMSRHRVKNLCTVFAVLT